MRAFVPKRRSEPERASVLPQKFSFSKECFGSDMWYNFTTAYKGDARDCSLFEGKIVMNIFYFNWDEACISFQKEKEWKFKSFGTALKRFEEVFNPRLRSQQIYEELKNLHFDTSIESSFTKNEALNKLSYNIFQTFHQLPLHFSSDATNTEVLWHAATTCQRARRLLIEPEHFELFLSKYIVSL